MTESKKINQLISECDLMVAHADGLKDRAARLRKKLTNFYSPTSPSRGRGKKVSPQVIAQVLAKRNKNMNKPLIKNLITA